MALSIDRVMGLLLIGVTMLIIFRAVLIAGMLLSSIRRRAIPRTANSDWVMGTDSHTPLAS